MARGLRAELGHPRPAARRGGAAHERRPPRAAPGARGRSAERPRAAPGPPSRSHPGRSPRVSTAPSTRNGSSPRSTCASILSSRPGGRHEHVGEPPQRTGAARGGLRRGVGRTGCHDAEAALPPGSLRNTVRSDLAGADGRPPGERARPPAPVQRGRRPRGAMATGGAADRRGGTVGSLPEPRRVGGDPRAGPVIPTSWRTTSTRRGSCSRSARRPRNCHPARAEESGPVPTRQRGPPDPATSAAHFGTSALISSSVKTVWPIGSTV